MDIRNEKNGVLGTITTLTNSQGGSDALTYGYKLPTNYKVVVNSDTDYGKVVFSNESSTTTFDVDSSSTYSGSTAKTYTDVISGITESEIDSCTSDTDCANNNDTGVLEGHYRYFLKLDDTNVDRFCSLVEEIAKKRNLRYKDKIVEVLAEGINPKDSSQLMGRTRTNRLTFFRKKNKNGQLYKPGDIVKVKIQSIRPFSISGIAID